MTKGYALKFNEYYGLIDMKKMIDHYLLTKLDPRFVS